MATEKQRAAARRNIKKAQQAWQAMSHAQHDRAQSQGRKRMKPGTKGAGGFYRIQVRPRDGFVTFRTQDVGSRGHLERVAGKRQSESWETQAWLIGKQDAHVEGDKLIPDTADARNLLSKLGTEPIHLKGDIFEARDRPDIPESQRPTGAQQRRRMENIKETQAVSRGEA